MIRLLRILTLTLGIVATREFARAGPYDAGTRVGTVTSPTIITEASGVAVGRANSNVLWTHNDSGDTARIFAISKTGSLLETFNLSGASSTDYEDIDIGPGPTVGVPYLYVGDIGDNHSSRASIDVYRAAEPAVTSGSASLAADRIKLVYPDGAHDAETLIVDPLTSDLYILTKSSSNGRLYKAAIPQSLANTITMQYLGNVGVMHATGGDISSDGTKLIIRNDDEAYEWTRSLSQSIATTLAAAPTPVPLQTEDQGEAIGYTPSGAGFYTMSEGTNEPLYFYAAVPEPASIGISNLAWVLLLRRRRAPSS